MAFSVQMPELGESITEGTVTRWLKHEGDTVEADEPLVEVSTDKVDTEIPSPATGVLQRILVPEDETVEVGAELAVINDSGEDSGWQLPETVAEQAQRSSQSSSQTRPPQTQDSQPSSRPALDEVSPTRQQPAEVSRSHDGSRPAGAADGMPAL